MKNPLLDFAFLMLMVAILIFITLSLFYIGKDAEKSDCLDSSSPRRWNGDICEQYIDGQWNILDSENSTYYYNDAAINKK